MKLVKKPLKIVLVLVVIVVIVVGVILWKVDSIAKTAIETGGTYALGVDTTVDDVGLSLLGGHIGVYGLNVANPPGYKTNHLMNVSALDVEMKTGTLFSDMIEVPLISLDGLSVNIEKAKGKSNIAVLTENLKKKSSGKDGEKPTEPATEEKSDGPNLRVDKVVIRNVEATVAVLPIGGDATTLKVKVPEIVLDNVTPDNAKGITISQLMKKLPPAIIAAVLEKGAGVIPADLHKTLSKDVAGLAANLGKGATDMLKQASGAVGGTVKDLQKKVDKDLGKNIGEGLKGLLGGDKKK